MDNNDVFQIFFCPPIFLHPVHLDSHHALSRGVCYWVVLECQVSTTPKMSKWVKLEVVVPEVEIMVQEDMFVTAGSDLVLECVIRNVITKPQFVTWITI